MNKESKIAIFLVFYGFILPTAIFFSMLIQHFQITIEEIDEIPSSVGLLLAVVFLMCPISWSLLLGWYIIDKVNQSSMSSIAMLEELQRQEMLNSESNNGTQNDFFDNNAIS